MIKKMIGKGAVAAAMRSTAGRQAMQVAVAHNTGAGKPLDPGLGWRLFRDRRVPAGAKALSLGLGVGLMVVLQILELPVQGLLAIFLPIIGWGINGIIDGAEGVLLPLLFGSILLPHLAPRAAVAEVRGEQEAREMRRVN